jgi:pimeloyl-ACP methyl ester carboxylesterase
MKEIETTEFEIDLQGGRLYSKTWSPRSAGHTAPVILLHDSLGCVAMWRGFPRELALHLQRPVVAYDRLGFGLSSRRTELPSTRFVLEEAELYFPEVKRQLGIGEFVLLGHSVGGAMAVSVASRFAKECRAVITESSQAYVERMTVESIAEGRRRYEDPAELAKLARFHGDKARWVVDAWTGMWLSKTFADWSLDAVLPQVTCPLLAIHGDHDEYGSTSFPDTFVRLAGGYSEKWIVEDCGHTPHWEKSVDFLERVARFLSTQGV